jgi:hypothetical protein
MLLAGPGNTKPELPYRLYRKDGPALQEKTSRKRKRRGVCKRRRAGSGSDGGACQGLAYPFGTTPRRLRFRLVSVADTSGSLGQSRFGWLFLRRSRFGRNLLGCVQFFGSAWFVERALRRVQGDRRHRAMGVVGRERPTLPTRWKVAEILDRTTGADGLGTDALVADARVSGRREHRLLTEESRSRRSVVQSERQEQRSQQ